MQNREYDPIGSSEARLQRLLHRREPLWRLIAASIYDVYVLAREARVTLIGFIILTFVNVIYLLFFYDHAAAGIRQFTVLSALYETLRMMALETDLPIPDGDVLGGLLFFITPLLGLALLFQGILNFGRFVLDKGSRREGWQVSLARTYRNHVVVCGLGSVTYRVIRELLEAGYDVVAIERDWNSEFLEATLALSVPVIHGDARSRETLRNAGITRARSVIAGLNDDLANVEIGLAARRLHPGITVILRIFNDELDLNLEQTFGHNSVFSASALAAPTLAAAALGRSIAHVLPLPPQFNHADGAPRLLGVLQQRIPPGSDFVGPLEELEERFEVRVLHHVRGGPSRWNSGKNHRPSERIEPGDEVALLGPLDQLERVHLVDQSVFNGQQPIIGLRSFSLVPLPDTDRAFDTVIVCGLGRIGFRVVRALSLMRPRPRVVLIYQHPDTDRELLEEVRRLVADLYQGDARLETVLRHAGIERACAVIAATGDDLTNMQIGLAARRLAPDIDLVLRVYNEDLAERLETLFGPHTTFSVPALAAPTLSAAAVVRGIDYAIEVAEQIYTTTILRVTPGDHLEGHTAEELRQKQRVLVLALRRAEETIKVTLNTRLQAGDEVAVLIDLRRLEQLHSRQAIRPMGRFRPVAPVKAQARR
ncbi:MAG: NAD-binding protein [Oscillochloridaceae bacterium]|nr:NAD-binding protein [Chloroflexaceae bacterium]MDW8391492.1 NAD-binding protein [Oscillochloridaceae bacterium]